MHPLHLLQNRMQIAAQKAGRDTRSIRLIAVTKGRTAEQIRKLCDLKQSAFGENYVQELLPKAEQLKELQLEWHFLGHLQRNKVAKVIDTIDWLHSLDSLELAQAIQQKAQRPLNCLLEIRLAPDSIKTGLSPDQAKALIPRLKGLDKIALRGLMTMAPAAPEPEASRPYFRALRQLRDTINQANLYPQPLTELSMGMSSDFEVAIAEGATMVRVGTLLFSPLA